MRAYLSHSIRGPKGKDATNTEMQENCNRAILVGKFIRIQIPSLDLYIPAEHEDFIGRAYRMKYLNEKQILEIDCSIIDSCDAVIIFLPPDDSELQGGRLIEYKHAIKTGKPVCEFQCAVDAVTWLTEFIKKG